MEPKLKKQIWKWRGILLIAPCVAGLVIALNSLGVFQLLEWAALDRLFRLRPQEKPDPRIVVVTIDESDIDYVNQWPVPDQTLATLLKNLKQYQPAAIGLDMYRDVPVGEGHQELVEVFESTPTLIGVEKIAGNPVKPPPALAKKDQVGLADLVIDADGKVRRGLISIKTDEGAIHLNLGIRLAMTYLEAKGITLELVNPSTMQLRLGKAIFNQFKSNDGAYVDADVGGYQILLNYRGNETNFHTVSLKNVLENKVDPEKIRGKIVLIGATGQSLNDLFFTPYSSHIFGSPQRMPGVFIHANLASQVLSGAIEGRPFIKVWDESREWLWIGVWSCVGATVSWMLLVSPQKHRNIPLKVVIFMGGIVLAGSSLLISSYVAFLASWWIPIIAPLVAFCGASLTMIGYYTRRLQRDSERKLTQFLEAMPVGVAVVDASGKPYYANKMAQQILGKGVMPSATPEQLPEVYQNYLAGTDQLYPIEKLPVVRALQGEESLIDDMEIHQGDKIVPIEARGIPIYDESGNIAYALIAFQDITERKKAELDRANLIDELFKVNCDLELALDSELEITDAYGRFVPHELLHLLGYESIVEVKLGQAVQLEMAIMFSDIRDFTAMSEQMTPEDNFKFINAYLSRMEPAITENHGFIDKYIGDAIMALFSGGADDAVKAAIAMLQRLAEYNLTRGRPGRPKISIGIGINTGSMMLGTVGGQNRMNGTVISDAVNLASRLEGLTKNYGVSLLISHQTFIALQNPHEYAIRLIDKVKVKGKSEMVTVYEVFDADPADLKTAKLKTKTLFEEALMFYIKENFSEAMEQFQTCLQLNPEDKVAQTYFQRCQQHLYS
jgi:adenylate cyclase